MLANGIKLSYKNTTTYVELTGLKEVPDMGMEPEKVENTTLSDTVKKYEFGIGDYGDLEFTFKYENKTATSPYRVLRGFADAKKVTEFKEEFPDGTTFEWSAIPNVKIGGGGVNSPVDFVLSMALQSDIKVTDPTGA